MTTNKKANENNEMNVQELKAMTITVNEKTVSLVSFIPNDDRQYIDKDGSAYYVAKLSVNFAKDVKNVTTGTKEEKAAKNAEILKNATGFKAACRDLTALAGKDGKGFLSLKAALPCPKEVNVNEAVSGLWLFSSKKLREDWLKKIQTGILNGSYRLEEEKKTATKELKKVKEIALVLDVSYEEAYKICVAKGIVKAK